MSNDLLASVSLQVGLQTRNSAVNRNLESGTPLPVEGKNPPTATATAPDPAPSNVVDVVDRLNQAMQSLRHDILFSIDEQSGETVIQVKNQETGEVIRQMPSEEALALARQSNESDVSPSFIIKARA